VSKPARLIPDLLIVLGLMALAAGAALVAVPAGLAVGGIEAVGLGYVLNLDRARSAAAASEASDERGTSERYAVERKL
jgi:hypothetical protein